MELNTEEHFLLLFAFNLTLALLLHLWDPSTCRFFLLVIWFSPSITIFFLPPFSHALSSLHLPSVFPQSLWSPVFPAYHPLYLLLYPESYFLLTPFLPFPYFPSTNQSPTPYQTCKLIFPLLTLLSFWSPSQIHADPRNALCFPYSLSLFCFLHSHFDIFGAGSLSGTHEGGSIPAPEGQQADEDTGNMQQSLWGFHWCSQAQSQLWGSLGWPTGNSTWEKVVRIFTMTIFFIITTIFFLFSNVKISNIPVSNILIMNNWYHSYFAQHHSPHFYMHMHTYI